MSNVRPTMKQKILLEFIKSFIATNGYSPSYREIMNGCDYNSVATVSLHVNNLIARGHLRKRDRSARSLEVVEKNDPVEEKTEPKKESQWLIGKIADCIDEFKRVETRTEEDIAKITNLLQTLRYLDLGEYAEAFEESLDTIPQKSESSVFEVDNQN